MARVQPSDDIEGTGSSHRSDIEGTGSSPRYGKWDPPVDDDHTPIYAVVENRSRRSWFSWIVPLFVLANLVLFVILMYVNDCPKRSNNCVAGFLGRFAFQPMKENPLFGPSSTTLENMGALVVNKVVQGHQVWRLITCIWLHAGVFHILANMLSLLFIGIRLEQEFGFVKIGIIYVLAGLGGSIVSSLFIQSSISVGASSALFGLLGAMLSELLINWTIYANKFAALLTLIFIITINLAVGVLPHVDNNAHIGGFLSGFLLGFVFLIRPQHGWVNRRNMPQGYMAVGKPKHKVYQYVLLVAALLVLIVGYTIGLLMVFWGVNGNAWCSWCRYWSCVPTSKWGCKSQNITCSWLQKDDHLDLTCLNNGRTKTFATINATQSQTASLCSQLCG